MMAIDTSAVIAVILGECEGAACNAALESDTDTLMSAGTLTETLIVAHRRGIAQQVSNFISKLAIRIEPLSEANARRAADAHARWGRGSAGLNFGDCFAYEIATRHDCPLLFVGHDFARTDVKSAL